MARDSDNEGTEPEHVPSVSSLSKDQISKALKQVYNGVAEEPLPDRFNDLLAQLKSGNGK